MFKIGGINKLSIKTKRLKISNAGLKNRYVVNKLKNSQILVKKIGSTVSTNYDLIVQVET